MKTICELLSIEKPILQGGMANIATGAFAAAVSNAGGLGIIATGGRNAAQIKIEIEACRALTDKPFGVNLMLMNPDSDALAQLVADMQVPVVTTGAGNPAKYIAKLKEAGVKVIPVVPSVGLARRMEAMGVDAIIAEGTESGGHVGETTTMVLVPQIVDAISIPVIAAGGIASGRQLVAALALGAQGVQVGTCLLVSEECPIHINYKMALLNAKDIDTVVTGRSVGAPVRCLRNQMTKTYIEMEKQGTTVHDLEVLTLGSMRRAVFDGDVQNGSVMAGQVAGMLKEIKPIQGILDEMIGEANTLLKAMGIWQLP
ncbi:MAG: nitronate monooxygenase [Erysipelotrichaceae bacterium]